MSFMVAGIERTHTLILSQPQPTHPLNTRQCWHRASCLTSWCSVQYIYVQSSALLYRIVHVAYPNSSYFLYIRSDRVIMCKYRVLQYHRSIGGQWWISSIHWNMTYKIFLGKSIVLKRKFYLPCIFQICINCKNSYIPAKKTKYCLPWNWLRGSFIRSSNFYFYSENTLN